MNSSTSSLLQYYKENYICELTNKNSMNLKVNKTITYR